MCVCRFEQKAVFAVVVPQLDYLRDTLRNKGLEDVAVLNASSLCASKEAMNLVSHLHTFVCMYFVRMCILENKGQVLTFERFPQNVLKVNLCYYAP